MSEANTGMTDSSASAPVSSAPSPEAAPAAASSTPTPSQSSAPSMTDNAPVLGEDGNPVPPQFQPDWKYKVKDKEYEIEEWARSVAKDEETYKKLKRVFERHTGLDEVVQGRDQLKTQLAQIEPQLKEYQQVSKSLNEISHFYNTGDLDSFFERLKIPEDVIFNWLKGKHQRAQLPQEVQAQLENARQAQLKAYNYEQELNQLKQRDSQSQAEQQVQVLDNAIASKAGHVASKFNEAQGGNPQAFRNYVVFKGQTMTRELGRPATVDEVLDQTVKELSSLMGGQMTPQAPAATPGANGAPPVIPVVKAGSQSPVRQPVKSIADMRKLAQNFE
jgi:phage shock protein A